jgi:hypothetical protein
MPKLGSTALVGRPYCPGKVKVKSATPFYYASMREPFAKTDNEILTTDVAVLVLTPL